jgi:peptidoglycan/xylan/chitin deacetylase (PgdA/CDA1 family)
MCLGRTITHVATEEPLIALTFDDGPHPSSTPEVLDLLDNHEAKATFFMVGQAVELYPQIANRVAAEGHAVGNHSSKV